MRAVAIVFVACLSLFTARFAACEGSGPSDGPVYEDVLKNSINRFLQSRKLECNNSEDTTKFNNTGLIWSQGRGDFEVSLMNTNWKSDCNYVVTGVKLRGYPGTPKISFGLNLTIPKVTIDAIDWLISGTWKNREYDDFGDFPIVYRNMTATIQIDVELTNKGSDVDWLVTGTHIDTRVALLPNPVEKIPLLKYLPKSLNVSRIQIELKEWISTQLQTKLSTFCEELFRGCPWKPILFGRF